MEHYIILSPGANSNVPPAIQHAKEDRLELALLEMQRVVNVCLENTAQYQKELLRLDEEMESLELNTVTYGDKLAGINKGLKRQKELSEELIDIFETRGF